ncbi:hypothetical protein HBI47_248790 [Parastagonospora nodorum]|nr:hypothetical protein HBI76_070510 [Parastagonospora nodorum]KAH5392615.1 hypothetical protein HBI47_248790 [Parastagonospora nodorum]KAH6359398.1 hypothetical protein HBI34_206740 [Parastagonospora nodorum]
MLSDISHALEPRRRVQNRMAQRRFRRKRADKGKAAQTEDAPPDTTIEHFQQSPGSERTCLTSSVVQAPRQGFGVATPGTFSGGLLYDVSFLSFENSSGEDLLPNLFAPSQEAIHDLPSTHRSSTGGDQILDDRNASSAAASPPQNETHLTSIESSAHMGGNQASWHETSASRASSSPSDIGSDVPKWLSPLHMASSKGQTRITRILLEHNADCNEQDSDGHTPLMHAVMSGSEEMVRLLLVHGASISIQDRRNRSAFHHAVLHRRQKLLRMLLDRCPHGDERTRLLESYDDSGRTQLHIAIDEEFEEAVLLLLQFGANPCSRKWGQETNDELSKD